MSAGSTKNSADPGSLHGGSQPSAGEPRRAEVTPPAGLFADKFRLLKLIGKGAMGEVWLAEQEGPRNFRRRVAVKRLLGTSDISDYAHESFAAEAQVIAKLDHPNIVRLVELGSVEGMLYLVLDYVDGAALDKMIKKGGPLAPPAVALLGREVARALEAVHDLCDENGNNYGVVHRDVTPSNILVSRDGRVRLTDFGVARISGFGGDKTEAGVFKGKLPYMPPEQARGEPFDGRADIFSLAISLFECLLGRRLRKAETQTQLILKIATEPVERVRSLLPDTPAALADAIDRATAVNPRERFADAGELAAALDDALRSLGPGAEKAGREELMQRVVAIAGAPIPAGAGAGSISTPEERKAEWSVAVGSTGTGRRDGAVEAGTAPTRRTPLPDEAPTVAVGSASAGRAMSVTEAQPLPRTRTPLIAAALVGVGALAAVAVFALQPKGGASQGAVVTTAAPSVAPTAQATTAPPATIAAAVTATATAAPEVTTEAPKPAPTPTTAVRPIGTSAPRSPVPATGGDEASAGPGTLQVVVLPWADVSVDGRPSGTTPIAPISLPPGPHTVVLRNGELGVSRTVGVVIKPGKPYLLRMDLKRSE